MNNSVVSKFELDHLKNDCESYISDLRKVIKHYCDTANQLNDVINSLRRFYDTEGGRYKTEEIANIDISEDSFKAIIESVDSINISYFMKDSIW